MYVFKVTMCGFIIGLHPSKGGVEVVLMLTRRRDGGPTLKQHWVNASCLLGCNHSGCSAMPYDSNYPLKK